MRISAQAADPNSRPVRQLPQLRKGIDHYGIPNDGPSPWGSTTHKQQLMCTREFGFYDHGIRTLTPSDPLDTGIIFHHGMELYYGAIQAFQASGVAKPGTDEFFFGGQREGAQLALRSVDKLRDAEGYEDVIEDATRCLDTYFEQHYRRDRWRIMANEETLLWDGEKLPKTHPLGFRYSSRLDLIVEEDNGTWLVEHKSAKFISADLLDHYEMDLQVLGHKWLWEHCVDTSKYPPLKGVLVNIVSKQKEPRCVRVPVNPSKAHMAEWENMLRTMRERKAWAVRNDYPKSLGHCSGYARGYSRCDYYDLCHDFPAITPKQWNDYELPERYTRVSEND
jgi:hypothetical protein